jgi:tripartite-type tricarboxylate transporter receptor subunit TctC
MSKQSGACEQVVNTQTGDGMAAIRLLGTCIGFMIFACGMAWGQQYPAKPVRVIIVFAPGGATDIVGRIAFQKVGEQLNQQFVIDNRAGAAGTIGAAIVAKSPRTATHSWCIPRHCSRMRISTGSCHTIR